ncbi:hypothetical protein BDV59DRAFT_205821 [Aspergillus ambiguus]|uniref:uncharacterized protein n=1 Tax=Aspergillus ambiguus TaxID=176160 RepID=UPI003CCE249D
MGQGTPPRSLLSFNRNCDPYPCPGTDPSISVADQEYSENNNTSIRFWNNTIPQGLVEMFDSGRGTPSVAPTVSSIWDIQWRTYTFKKSTKPQNLNNGSVYLVGAYRHIETMVLNNRVEAVEGLIVDMQKGGVGFRNHSLPPWNPHGSKWTEDLLFVEPHTSCVDLNLTIDFTLRFNESELDVLPTNVVLTDRGGFSHLTKEQPEHSTIQTQENVDLQHKAYTAAWLTNALTMVYMNVTDPSYGPHAPHSFTYLNSNPGKRFPLRQQDLPNSLSYSSLYTTSEWANFLDLVDPRYGINSTDETAVHYSNPFNITRSNFTLISTLCAGTSVLDYANMTNIAASCGVVYGAARRTDGGNSLVSELGSNWTIPIYSCASAAKALIKTVEFRFNDSSPPGNLAGLSVVNVVDKTYPKPEDRPIWGVENTTLPLLRAQPLWGLVSDAYGGRDDVTLLQSESLWLPGYRDENPITPVMGYINLPGIEFHTRPFGIAYDLSYGDSPVGDYRGTTSNAMYARWQKLSETASSASKIINFIWTDIVANSVVGTRGWSSEDIVPAEKRVPVIVYRRAIQYRMPFGVPAFILIFLLLATVILMVALRVSGRRQAKPAVVRRYLNSTSLGRAMTGLLYPEYSDMQVSTAEWLKLAGKKQIHLGGPIPRGEVEETDNSDSDDTPHNQDSTGNL